MGTTKRKVASFFVRHVPDFGIVVGNEGEDVNVPDHLIAEWEDEGLIAKKAGAKKADERDPLDHDGNGRKGGAAPPVDTAPAQDAAP